MKVSYKFSWQEMEDWRLTTTISCMVRSDEPSLSQLLLLFQFEGQPFLSPLPLLLLLFFGTTIQSITQSMFYFMSVHTEVILDNNSNTWYLQTRHLVVLSEPTSLYGGTLKKWTKQTTLNKQKKPQKYKQQQTKTPTPNNTRQTTYVLWNSIVKALCKITKTS